MNAIEANFDGLVGPTHNYGGLASGNLAAAANEGQVSNPRAGGLQGLAKMRALMRMGLVQGVLPPHERPHLPSLRRMGFGGSDAQVLEQAGRATPHIITNVSSASAMWTANAATVSPSADTADGRVHITPANLFSHFHRALEAETTTRMLRTIFSDEIRFKVHDPVPFPSFGDEGAANHCRLTSQHGARGMELFVYGRSAFARAENGELSGRQAMEACHVVASTHALWGGGGAVLAQQGRAAIAAGAFHNDVVAVSNENVLLYHADAFAQHDATLDALRRACARHGFEPLFIQASSSELSLADAVQSYVFNSQLVTLPEGGMALILPMEAEEKPAARAFVERVLADNGPIRQAMHFDLRQSMRNGGGPACLRLRVVLTDEERNSLGASVLADEAKLDALEDVVARRYRDRLSLSDLADPQLLDESRSALDEFSAILGLGSIYDFQTN